MKRREFITLISGAAITAPFGARAQQPNNAPHIGIIGDSSLWDHFRQGLRDLGYVEGQKIVIDSRTAQGDFDQLRQVALELVSMQVDVVAASGSTSVRTARQFTSTIPIVMVGVGDPVRARFTAELAHPSANITGTSNIAPFLIGKRIEILKECVPGLARVAFHWNPDKDSNLAFLEELIIAVPALGLQLISVPMRTSNDFDGAFIGMMERRPNAFAMSDELLLLQHLGQIIEFMARHRLPAMYQSREDVEAGDLMSYGASLSESFRRSAWYVHRILQGAKPGELPIEQPTKFELTINLKTAKALGLTIPPAILARADEVIE